MYIAHKRDDGEVQPLIEHLHNTACIASKKAILFGKEELAYICGLLHDLGKYSEEFQHRIKNNGRLCDHSTAGALLLRKHNIVIGNFLGYIIAGHHSGLLNGGGWGSSKTDKSLYGRLKKQIPDFSAYSEELNESEHLKIAQLIMQISDVVRDNVQDRGYSLSFLIRMIFSCLVDADYLDTEQFMKDENVVRGVEHNFSYLESKHIKHATSFISDTFIKEKRRQILNQCIEKAANKPGVFRLTVPTGGGKTISSMAFALRHIINNPKLRRVIYVIPFTSIIEQNAKVFSDILGDQYILEHHSNFDFNDKSENEYNVKKLATENWDMPVIVTTNVQFFESIYGNRSSKLRKLHNVANSLIILDEVQMLPTEHMLPCIKALEELVKNYNCTVVLCSATQPEVERFMSDDIKVREICSNINELYDIFNKTKVRFIGNKGIQELSKQLRSNKQSLTIVNTKRQAAKLYEQIKEDCKEDDDGLFHLSTYMCPQHRHEVIEVIKNRLNNGEKCIVVSTSLIEAGVDVDFPVVYRAMCGLDSIIQAAGRCNRERIQELAYIYVFDFSEEELRVKRSSVYGNYLGQRQSITEIISKKHEDVMTPEAIKDYFDMLFGNMDQSELDKKNIVKRLNEGFHNSTPTDFMFDFEDIANEFRIIEESTCSVIVRYNEEAEREIRQFEYGYITRNKLRFLQKYTVNLSEHEYRKLKEIKAINEIGEKIGVLVSTEDYSNKTGVRIVDQLGIAEFV